MNHTDSTPEPELLLPAIATPQPPSPSRLSPLTDKTKFLLGILAAALVTTGGGFYYYQSRVATNLPTIAEVNSQGVALGFNPSSLTVAYGTTQTVDLVLNSGSQRVAIADLTLTYDPAQLEVLSVTPTDLLPSRVVAPKIENGRITFAQGDTPDSGGVTVDGTIATLSVKPKAAGTLKVDGSSIIAVINVDTNRLLNFPELTFQAPAASLAPSPTAAPTTSPSTNPQPTVNPTSSPTAAPTSTPTTTKTTLKTKFDPTCTSITYEWTKVSSAAGYYVDLSTTSDFKEFTSSGRLPSSQSEVTFPNLRADTTYYARLTLADIPNYPDYNYAASAKTKCAVATASTTPTPTPTATPSPTPTPKPTATPIKATSLKTPTQTATPRPTVTTRVNTPAVTAPSTAQTVGDLVGDNAYIEDTATLPETVAEPEAAKLSFLQWLLERLRELVGLN